MNADSAFDGGAVRQAPSGDMTAASPQSASSVESVTYAGKRHSTAAARTALLGGTLHALPALAFEPAAFVIAWRGLTKSFEAIDDVEAWLDRFEGKSPK